MLVFSTIKIMPKKWITSNQIMKACQEEKNLTGGIIIN